MKETGKIPPVFNRPFTVMADRTEAPSPIP